MPVYGMKTTRGAFLAIATGMAYHASIYVKVTNGTYEVSFRFDEDMDNLYEDPVVEYHLFTDPKADYNEMAHVYHDFQFARKAFSPLKERAAKRPELAYAVRCSEVRIRQAWKPVPSPVPRQTAATEPPVKCVVPFVRVTELARRMKAAGIKEAELCLVGWNKGRHDGAYPQLFPVEPVLGGEAALRQCVKDVQVLGYQIVAHGNHRDCYKIADSWDMEYVNEKDSDGVLLPAERTWGGGDKYTICAKRCYERFVHKDAEASKIPGRGDTVVFENQEAITLKKSDPLYYLKYEFRGADVTLLEQKKQYGYGGGGITATGSGTYTLVYPLELNANQFEGEDKTFTVDVAGGGATVVFTSSGTTKIYSPAEFIKRGAGTYKTIQFPNKDVSTRGKLTFEAGTLTTVRPSVRWGYFGEFVVTGSETKQFNQGETSGVAPGAVNLPIVKYVETEDASQTMTFYKWRISES